MDVAAAHAASASGVRSRGARCSDTWAAARTLTTPRSWSSRLGSMSLSQVSSEAVLALAVVGDGKILEWEEEMVAVEAAADVVVIVVLVVVEVEVVAACVVVMGV